MSNLKKYTVPAVLVIVVGLAVSSAGAAIVAEDVSNYWSMNGNAKDWVGLAHGTLGGTTTYSTNAAAGGQALSGDGVSGQMATSAIVSSNFTISAWVCPISAGGGSGGRIFETRDAALSRPDGLMVYTTPTSIDLWFADGAGHLTTKSLALSTLGLSFGEYFHFTMTVGAPKLDMGYPLAQTRVFINGVDVWTEQWATIPLSNKLNIGGNQAGNRAFDGQIDEVTVFNRMLTYAEIQDFYTNMDGTVATLVPEPTTCLLLLAGSAMAITRRNRRGR